ncbi:MAG: CRISPR/Cas system-associated exonuclease Cas4 (RecB family) [Planctomycetota bacterium]|jgi:CRISPR/Cas system-associated exonuclease Cas4 (RecB family)
MAFKHELSWSASRNRQFDECARAYYWTYYGSWGGWSSRDGDPARDAWILKKLTRLPMWAGDCLHDALEWWFAERARGSNRTAQEVEARALTRLRNGYKESRDGLWKSRPAKMTHLAEHRYGEALVNEASGEAATYGKRFVDRIQTGVRCFFEHPDLAVAREADPATYLACESMGTMTLFDTKVYAVPDFAWRDRTNTAADPEGEVRILDWKTGKPNPADRFQLALYALYAELEWGVDGTKVRTADVYLSSGEITEYVFEREELDNVYTVVGDSLTKMREVHFDADRSAGDPEAFPMLGDSPGESRTCGRCNYRSLCGRELK